MEMKGEERRKHIRIFLPGGHVRLASGPLFALVGKVIDLSTGGIKFTCGTELGLGDELNMEVTLPTGMKFRCTARVAHLETIEGKDQKLYGAQFVNLSADEQNELGEFIMRQRAEQDSLLHNELGGNTTSSKETP